jgi:3-oxoacyl-[acyl-carrier protein] reductase
MVCLVTGSSRGLGKSIAIALGNKGHNVAIHCKERIKEAETVVSKINDSILLKADVSNYEDVERIVKEIVKKWGRIDVLVNNAGITMEALLLRTGAEEFDEIVSVNLKGTFNCIRSVCPYMVKQRSGNIINISSIVGVTGRKGLCAYTASKAGIIGLTRAAARELGRYNIMVNAVLPGYMLTDMGRESSQKAKDNVLKDSLIKKYSNPDDVAEFICFLTETKGISGQVFNLDSRII